MQPGNSHTATQGKMANHIASSLNDSDTLVTRNDRAMRFNRPVTLDCMQVRVTDAAMQNPNQHIESVPQMGLRDRLNFQGLVERF